MHRTTGDSAGTDPVGGQPIFRQEDPLATYQATQVDFSIMNALQEELANIIIGFGGALNSSSETIQQMNQAYTRIKNAIDAEAFTRNANDRIASGVLCRDELNAVNTDLGETTVLESLIKACRSYINGFKLTRSAATDVSIGLGACTSLNLDAFISLASATTKDLSAVWAPGTGNGGRPSTVLLQDLTWYNVFVIKHADGTIDAGFDITGNASNLLTASGYSYARRVGSVLYVNAGTGIRPFFHVLDSGMFMWASPYSEGGTQVIAPTPAVTTIQIDKGRPAGIELEVLFTGSASNPTAGPFDCRVWDGILGSSFVVNADSFYGVNANENLTRPIVLTPTVTGEIYAQEQSANATNLTLFVRGYRDNRTLA